VCVIFYFFCVCMKTIQFDTMGIHVCLCKREPNLVMNELTSYFLGHLRLKLILTARNKQKKCH
jgi:hypothetical protein